MCGYSRRSRLAMAPCGRCACPAAAGGGTSGVLAACKVRSTGCQQRSAYFAVKANTDLPSIKE